MYSVQEMRHCSGVEFELEKQNVRFGRRQVKCWPTAWSLLADILDGGCGVHDIATNLRDVLLIAEIAE